MRASLFHWSPLTVLGAALLAGCGNVGDAPDASDAALTTSVAFQNGVSPLSSYAGSEDTSLLSSAPATPRPGELTGIADQDYPDGTGKHASAALRFDVSAIPAGSRVTAASLTLNVTNITAAPGYNLYPLLRSWSAAQATWNSAASGSAWATPGALGASDRGSAVLGTVGNGPFGTTVINLTAAGVAAVQSWVDHPAQNFGFLIGSATNTDGLGFDGAAATVATHRPKLSVSYGTAASTGAGTGTGLLGQYFTGTSFNTLATQRTDATLNFDWGSGSPASGVPVDSFSIRWTGQVQPLYSETYTFTSTSDDGVRVWVNGVKLIDNWTQHAATDNSGSISLKAGSKYDLKVEYYENAGNAVAKLAWASPSRTKQIIPAAQLYPASAGGGGGTTDAGTPPSTNAPPFDWVGVVGTGQSLSVGLYASTVLSSSQPFHNMKLLDTGSAPLYPLSGDVSRYALTPLTEKIRARGIPGSGPGYDDEQYPNNVYGETPQSGMANQVSALWAARNPGGDYVTLHSAVGLDGSGIDGINKEGGQRSYQAALMEARAFTALAKKSGKSFGYGAVVLTHGETDNGNPQYFSKVTQLYTDYNSDLKAITGQSREVVMLASQESSIPAGRTSSAIQLWQASQATPNIIVVGPKYQYEYEPTTRVHFYASGYKRLGEKYAEVFDAVVNRKQAWKPVAPLSATRAGATLTLKLSVPNPPLQWDLTLLPNHQSSNTQWAKGHGFEAYDAAGTPLTIASANITAADTVTVVLAAVPSTAVTLSYATTQDAPISEKHGGLINGLRGQLRDSDTFVGRDDEAITALVTKGAATLHLTGTVPTDRTARDVVTGAGAPADWTIMTINSSSQWTMSAPWTGATGTVSLRVHYDQHNYAVHSKIVAP